jgi:hypothetical protein
MTKEYIGDSVYADVENGMLKLTTEQGDDVASNTIYLELAVWENLLGYMKHACEQVQP